ncbi:hypothetical protein NL676_020255 [Syzygium grande]|nr:hypothetical protein NL676_020255 [Syzygium grande]
MDATRTSCSIEFTLCKSGSWEFLRRFLGSISRGLIGQGENSEGKNLGMYKNQLQELAQRSCFNLPSYSCIREGPDHAPRFKATVNFNGETFESPTFCSTLRQAEHSAAEVALTALATKGPSRALAAKVLDETGVYKNLLQETAHRAGLNLPAYSTIRSGPGHVPSFSCTVELAGKSFTGQPARTKKQAQKNAAMAAWSALRKMSRESMSSCSSSAPLDSKASEEQEQYQNWAYSSFPHQMVTCHMWEQEKLFQQQLHLVRLPIPSTISSPQILPNVQSVINPDSCQHFPARQFCSPVLGPRIAIATSVPSFCFSNQVIPDSMSSRPRLTIQEIQEEQVEESSGFPTTLHHREERQFPGQTMGRMSPEIKRQSRKRWRRSSGWSLGPAFGFKMLVLFETPAGFALFKVLDEGKLSKVEDLWKDFSSAESARKVVKLKAFSKFENTAEALSAATCLIESKPYKGLRKFLRAHCDGENLAVADSKLGNAIKEKLQIECVHNNAVMELMRGVRSQLTELISGLAVQDLAPMSLGLSHSLSRYKLKFSADKVDTMIIQAIGLLDDLDKELNTYAMRVREWYGWHFPELGKIIQDNILYAKTVKLMGDRTNASKLDFSGILPEEVETELKAASEISMGTEVSELDLLNIKELCDQVLSLSEYRGQLYDYLKSRMNTIAPNLTAMVGELVGARLIAHGGSLLNLAKQPGSTVQILGAEKALFRALKTKHATPKYGLIYHASLIGQAAPKLKGKISRSLAAKTALAIRYDALGDTEDNSMGLENRAKLEARLRNLEGRELGRSAGSAKGKPKIEVYDKDRKKGAGALITAAKTYNPSVDSTLGQTLINAAGNGEEMEKKKRRTESVPSLMAEVTEQPPTGEGKKEKKKKKKKVDEEETTMLAGANGSAEADGDTPAKKDKKKKKKKDAALESGLQSDGNAVEEEMKKKKKKKKRKHAEQDEEDSEQPSKRKEKKEKKRSED